MGSVKKDGKACGKEDESNVNEDGGDCNEQGQLLFEACVDVQTSNLIPSASQAFWGRKKSFCFFFAYGPLATGFCEHDDKGAGEAGGETGEPETVDPN